MDGFHAAMAYVVCGLTKNNLIISWSVAVGILIIAIVVMYFAYPRLKSGLKTTDMDNDNDVKKDLLRDYNPKSEYGKPSFYNDSLI